jgi:hypothetical protein
MEKNKMELYQRYTLLCGILLTLFFFPSCENDLESIRKFDYYEEIPTEVAQDVEMMYSDSFQVRVIVRTPKLIRYGGAKPREEFKGGLVVDFIGDNLQRSSQLTAKGAIKKTITIKDDKGRNVREPVVIIQDSVVLEGSNGELLFTDELMWFENEGKLSTDKWVKIVTKDKNIFGFGFESDKEFKNWKIRSVVGEFQSDGLVDGFND